MWLWLQSPQARCYMLLRHLSLSSKTKEAPHQLWTQTQVACRMSMNDSWMSHISCRRQWYPLLTLVAMVVSAQPSTKQHFASAVSPPGNCFGTIHFRVSFMKCMNAGAVWPSAPCVPSKTYNLAKGNCQVLGCSPFLIVSFGFCVSRVYFLQWNDARPCRTATSTYCRNLPDIHLEHHFSETVHFILRTCSNHTLRTCSYSISVCSAERACPFSGHT